MSAQPRHLGPRLIAVALVLAAAAVFAGSRLYAAADSEHVLLRPAVPVARVTAAEAAAAAQPLVVTAHRPRRTWAAVASVHGNPAVWVRRAGSVTLARFDQRYVRLVLHAGRSDGGTGPWAQGNRVTAAEKSSLVAAVNGGFKLSYKDTGFLLRGHTAVPLRAGLASIVSYTDGTTNIGAWGQGLPDRGRSVLSVLQNQHLLVNNGVPAGNLESCVINCWGGTIGLLTVVARSGLGIDAAGRLIWVAGEHLSPAQLAHELVAAGAQRAIELDINPFWIAGYIYTHPAAGPHPVPLVAGQRGINGAFMRSYSRDFLTFLAR